jgi:hypothetical protein
MNVLSIPLAIICSGENVTKNTNIRGAYMSKLISCKVYWSCSIEVQVWKKSQYSRLKEKPI